MGAFFDRINGMSRTNRRDASPQQKHLAPAASSQGVDRFPDRGRLVFATFGGHRVTLLDWIEIFVSELNR